VARKIQNNVLKSSGLTELLKTKTFATFNPKEQPEMYKIALDYAVNFKEIEAEKCNGLAFVGAIGNGKTHLLTAIANYLLDSGVQVIFVNTPELIAELRQAQFDDGQSITKKIDHIKNARIVIFDDLAKEKITAWVATQYYMIINHRYIHGLPVLFSSNCDFEELEEKIQDPAIVSRLMAMTKDRLIVCKGDDYRIKE